MGGIFVTKRIQALRKNGVEVIPYIYYMDYSKTVQNYLEKISHMSALSAPLDMQGDVQYSLKGIRQGFFSMAAASLFPEKGGLLVEKQLEKDVRSEGGVDLIHLHWFWPLGLGVYRYCKKHDIPYVITCHGSDINVNMDNPKLQKSMKIILEGAAAVEFVSEALLNRAKSFGYSGKNAEVIYNGIDGSIFAGNKREATDVPLVGFVGNLIPVKGADRLPKIFSKIYEEMEQQVSFCVIGEGELKEKLQKEMSELPVKFTGQLGQQKLAGWYSKMAVLILPSRNEGYPCVIKEAQACGAILVASHVGGAAEAVAGYGSTVSAEGTEEAFAEKLAAEAVAYLKQEKTVNQTEMMEQASAQTWEAMQRKSCQIYRRIIDKQ